MSPIKVTARSCVTPWNNGDISVMSQSDNRVSSREYSRHFIEYTPYSKTVRNKVDFKTSHTNRSSVSDSVTLSVSRTVKSSLTLGGSVELGAIVKKINLKAEVSAGVEKTVSHSVTINVAPGTTKYLEYGSKTVETSGKIRKYDTLSCSEKTFNTRAVYTTEPYSKSWDQRR